MNKIIVIECWDNEGDRRFYTFNPDKTPSRRTTFHYFVQGRKPAKGLFPLPAVSTSVGFFNHIFTQSGIVRFHGEVPI